MKSVDSTSLGCIKEALINQFSQFRDQGILFETYHNDGDKIIYLEPCGKISFSVVNAHFAVLIAKGCLSLEELKLPETKEEGDLYYSLKIPLNRNSSERFNQLIYITSSNLEQNIVVDGLSLGGWLWLFCTSRGVREFRTEFSDFLNQLTLGSMIQERTISACIMANGKGRASMLRLLNRYEKVPFLSSMLVHGD